MRKSNWVIMAILLVASAFFLFLWYYLKFNLVDNPLDLVLTIIWWVLIVAVCVVIRQVEKKRQERARTCYVASKLVYNSEAGIVDLAGTTATEAIQGILEGLKYDFSIADEPARDPGYAYVVRSIKFKDADTWEGEVALPARPDDEPTPFSSKDELKAIIEG